MNPLDPQAAQSIVGAYAAVLEADAQANRYPGSLGALPYPRDAIKQAIHTSLGALAASGQLTTELRDFLEVSYVALADYVDEELARLMREYHAAAEALMGDARAPGERAASSSWQVLADSGRLAGMIARAIATDTEQLRGEFRALEQRLSVPRTA